MLLYMRDAGFIYGGNIYALTEEKERLDELRKNKSEAAKRRRDQDEGGLMSTSEITKERYEQIKKKDNKTKEEQYEIRKYIIQKRYKVANTPKWFIRAIKNKHLQYDNIKCI